MLSMSSIAITHLPLRIAGSMTLGSVSAVFCRFNGDSNLALPGMEMADSFYQTHLRIGDGGWCGVGVVAGTDWKGEADQQRERLVGGVEGDVGEQIGTGGVTAV